MTIEGACAELGIGRSRFHAMRTRFLSEATALLEPRSPGPAAHVPTEAEREAERLRDRVQALEAEVHVAKVREDLAMTRCTSRLRAQRAPGLRVRVVYAVVLVLFGFIAVIAVKAARKQAENLPARRTAPAPAAPPPSGCPRAGAATDAGQVAVGSAIADAERHVRSPPDAMARCMLVRSSGPYGTRV